MAELKNPNSTRPFRVVPGAVSGRTQPLSVQQIAASAAAKSPVASPAAGSPSDGMLARRREIERKKRLAKIQEQRRVAEFREGWGRILKTVLAIVFFGGAGYAYWRVQTVYGNEWPMMAVWIFLGSFLFGGIFLLLWYMNRTEW